MAGDEAEPTQPPDVKAPAPTPPPTAATMAPVTPAAGSMPPPAPAAPPPPKANATLQILVQLAVVIVVAMLALLPLSFAGLFALAPTSELASTREVQLLIVCSLLLYGALAAFLKAGFEVRATAKVGVRIMHRTKRELVLNAVSVGTTILLILLVAIETLALLAFLDIIPADSSASIAFSSNYVLFATFTLLYLGMMLMARISYQTRVELKDWHKAVAFGAIPLSVLIILLALLLSMGLLQGGIFGQITPRQSVYVLTLAVFFQFLAFKLLLRYPPIVKMALGAVEAAKKAGKDVRDEIQRRALRTYMIGLGFLLASILFISAITTRRITLAGDRSSTLILVIYLVIGVVVLGVLVTRYVQHQYIARREQRQARGEVFAGKRMSPEQIRRVLLFSFSAFFGLIFLIMAVLSFLGRMPWDATYGTDLLILVFLTGVGPYGFYRGIELKRQRVLDDKFPDFLRDLAESERAGMTLPRALLTAAKGTYGALTAEIRKMSAQVEWGISFTESLKRFAARAKTPLIRRTTVLINEAASAGGNVIDVLTAASNDAREIKQILEERKRQMGIYSIIIYIAFLVYLVVIFVLAAQFLPGFEAALGGGSGQQVGGLNLVAFDPEDYKTVFFHGALIQGIGGGLVAGVMTGGHPNDGLKHSVIMVIIAWIFFRVLL